MNLVLCHDALVIGGGPAGSTLAIALARAGRQVVLIEKNRTAEHKVCGDFLSPESLPLLRRAGVHPEAFGAPTIHSVRIATRNIVAEAMLPERALSLSRKTLDEALLRSAQQEGVNLLRGYAVHQLTQAEGNTETPEWRARITDTSGAFSSIVGKDAFLATGKYDLRGWARNTRATHNDMVALKMYFHLSPQQMTQLEGNVELILYPGGYAGLQPVEGGRANLCALITKKTFRAMEGRWERVLEHMIHSSPHLEHRLRDARPLLDRPLAITSIPYGYCADAVEPHVTPWRVGDQAAVIPSFCGEGMAIALDTAERAALLHLQGATASTFHAEVQHRFGRRMSWTSFLSKLLVTTPAAAQVTRIFPSLLPHIFQATRLPTVPHDDLSAVHRSAAIPHRTDAAAFRDRKEL